MKKLLATMAILAALVSGVQAQATDRDTIKGIGYVIFYDTCKPGSVSQDTFTVLNAIMEMAPASLLNSVKEEIKSEALASGRMAFCANLSLTIGKKIDAINVDSTRMLRAAR